MGAELIADWSQWEFLIFSFFFSNFVPKKNLKPQKKKNSRSFDQVLRDLTFVVKLDSGAIRKLFTLSGRPVLSLQDFFRDDDVFVAYGGNEKMAADDLLVASEEHKSVGSGTSSNMRRFCCGDFLVKIRVSTRKI